MNQDRIRDRILRRASRMWGYNESETENSFDPLVGLLISACASELEKLSFEQENSQARIIDRILEVMFPEEVAGALPAHTLLQVYPSQNNKSISLYNSFATKKRVQDIYNPQDTKEIDITFFPTIPLKLTTAKVKYIAYGNELIEQESFFSDEQIVGEQGYLLLKGLRNYYETVCRYMKVFLTEQEATIDFFLKTINEIINREESEIVNEDVKIHIILLEKKIQNNKIK